MKIELSILANTNYHFQSKGAGLNPENVTLVLEEASRRLGENGSGQDLPAEKKSFKQKVKHLAKGKVV